METLVSLGLRQSLGFTGLLDFARSVSIFHDSRDSKTLAQRRRLLTCLDAVALKLSTENGEGDCNRCENATLGQNSSVDDGNVKCVDPPKEYKDDQPKTKPDDWEDAADFSTSKLGSSHD